LSLLPAIPPLADATMCRVHRRMAPPGGSTVVKGG
jgi:hypothetical protein